MGRRHRKPPLHISAGAIANAEQEAAKALSDEQTKRAMACLAAIQKALADYRCEPVLSATFSNIQAMRWNIDVRALP